jgi:hypothetical protein
MPSGHRLLSSPDGPQENLNQMHMHTHTEQNPAASRLHIVGGARNELTDADRTMHRLIA